MKREAIIDSSGVYRYLLRRSWVGVSHGTALFIMLNPSTADDQKDDPTIRRCVGFAKGLLCDSLEVVNLFAMRATDPHELMMCRYRDQIVDPVGPENNGHIQKAAETASVIIAAWGTWRWSFIRERAQNVTKMLRWSGKVIYCLGKSMSGNPCHPLYLPKTSKIQPYSY